MTNPHATTLKRAKELLKCKDCTTELYPCSDHAESIIEIAESYESLLAENQRRGEALQEIIDEFPVTERFVNGKHEWSHKIIARKALSSSYKDE